MEVQKHLMYMRERQWDKGIRVFGSESGLSGEPQFHCSYRNHSFDLNGKSI